MNFEQFLQQKGIIPKGIARHQQEVGKYETWLERTHDRTPENATKKDLLEYLQYIKERRKLANGTQNNILQKLKNYHAYLAKEYETNDITCFIKIRGTKRQRLRPLFMPDELDLLCDVYYYHIQEYQPTNNKLRFYPDHKKLLQGHYIALTLIAYQALRLQEIENLTQADFDLRKATVNIHQSRKGAARKLPLEASQIGALLQFYADGEDSTLIPNRNHFTHLTIPLKKLHPKFCDFRQIRASKITHWLKLYGLRKAQHLAGHKSIRSTEQFLAGEFETLQNDMDNFHPLR